MIEHIMFNGQPLCYIVRAQLPSEKTEFLTPPEANLQVGYIVHPAGYEIPRHVHQPIKRNIVGTCEVLIVRKGRCEVDIYNGERQHIATRELCEGDIIIIVAGGHGFRMLEDTVLLEIKQGPYPGPEEKEQF